MHLNEFHFVSKSEKSLFVTSIGIGSLMTKHKSTLEIIEKELMSYGLKKYSSWHYDPLHIILDARRQVSLSMYTHDPKPELEILVNVDLLFENDENLVNMQVLKEVMTAPSQIQARPVEGNMAVQETN